LLTKISKEKLVIADDSFIDIFSLRRLDLGKINITVIYPFLIGLIHYYFKKKQYIRIKGIIENILPIYEIKELNNMELNISLKNIVTFENNENSWFLSFLSSINNKFNISIVTTIPERIPFYEKNNFQVMLINLKK
jgi:hypothetical protein